MSRPEQVRSCQALTYRRRCARTSHSASTALGLNAERPGRRSIPALKLVMMAKLLRKDKGKA